MSPYEAERTCDDIPGHPVTLKLTVGIHTVSEINHHEHWRYRQKRAEEQHKTVAVALLRMPVKPRIPTRDAPLRVKLIRLAPRKLDSDNLAGAMKHVRDAVAKMLCVDDGNEELVTWEVAQERMSGGTAVRIEFSKKEPACTTNS